MNYFTPILYFMYESVCGVINKHYFPKGFKVLIKDTRMPKLDSFCLHSCFFPRMMLKIAVIEN